MKKRIYTKKVDQVSIDRLIENIKPIYAPVIQAMYEEDMQCGDALKYMKIKRSYSAFYRAFMRAQKKVKQKYGTLINMSDIYKFNDQPESIEVFSRRRAVIQEICKKISQKQEQINKLLLALELKLLEEEKNEE